MRRRAQREPPVRQVQVLARRSTAYHFPWKTTAMAMASASLMKFFFFDTRWHFRPQWHFSSTLANRCVCLMFLSRHPLNLCPLAWLLVRPKAHWHSPLSKESSECSNHPPVTPQLVLTSQGPHPPKCPTPRPTCPSPPPPLWCFNLLSPRS